MIRVVSYGGGTNSTAMLIGLFERNQIPDLILFADTGGEKTGTYEYIKLFNKWLVVNNMPTITVVKQAISLEEDCLTRKALPGLAYGFKSCSDRWKIRPQRKYLKKLLGIPRHKGLTGVTWVIGIDADEAHRAKDQNNEYPLIDWDWGRDECIDIIQKEGLPLPGKSACFFCPSTKKYEINELKTKYPELYDRAIKMEENAELTTIKGLGRRFSWKDYMDKEEFPEIEQLCMCFDN